jgi:N-acetylmuramoyl-L-alanine amidase
MPSVLVETGFLTNRKEGAYLNSSKGQSEMSVAISKAIINYKNSLSSSVITSGSIGEAIVSETSEDPVDLKSTDVEFKIQIAASSKNLETKSYNFKGLDPIIKEKEGTLYRYYYGSADSYKKAEKLKKKAIRKGYKHAFIVAFKQNKKIKLSSIIKR